MALRVPEMLREIKSDEKCYNPLVVSLVLTIMAHLGNMSRTGGEAQNSNDMAICHGLIGHKLNDPL